MNHALDTNNVASIYFLFFIRSGVSNEQSCTCPAVQQGTICVATSSVKVKFTEKVRAPAINMRNQEDF